MRLKEIKNLTIYSVKQHYTWSDFKLDRELLDEPLYKISAYKVNQMDYVGTYSIGSAQYSDSETFPENALTIRT